MIWDDLTNETMIDTRFEDVLFLVCLDANRFFAL
jgi:hypothetical protein